MNDTTSLAEFALICISAMILMSLFVILYFMIKAIHFSLRERLFYLIFVILIITVNVIIINWYIETLSYFLIAK